MKLSAEELSLLRSLVEWRRASGWGFRHCGLNDEYWYLSGTWRVFVYDEEYEGRKYMVLRVDDRQQKAGLSVTWPRNLRDAVDVLCALGVLPLTFSSAFAAGRESAYTRDEWRVVAVNPRTGQELVNGPTDERRGRALLKVAHTFDPGARLEHRRAGETDWSRVDA